MIHDSEFPMLVHGIRPVLAHTTAELRYVWEKYKFLFEVKYSLRDESKVDESGREFTRDDAY